MDGRKAINEAMARVQAMRGHAEKTREAIRKRAGAWLEGMGEVSKRLDVSHGDAAAEDFNEIAALNLRRGEQKLRELRDGY